jgi:hypothetical protein
MSSGSEVEEETGIEEEKDLPPLIKIKDEEGEEVQGESSSEPLEPASSSTSEEGEETTGMEEDEDPSPLRYPPRERWHARWRSVEEGVIQRHQGRHQAFRIRRREVKQGTYVESKERSPIAPQIEWENAPTEGSAEWLRFQKYYWREERKRMVYTLGSPRGALPPVTQVDRGASDVAEGTLRGLPA